MSFYPNNFKQYLQTGVVCCLLLPTFSSGNIDNNPCLPIVLQQKIKRQIKNNEIMLSGLGSLKTTLKKQQTKEIEKIIKESYLKNKYKLPYRYPDIIYKVKQADPTVSGKKIKHVFFYPSLVKPKNKTIQDTQQNWNTTEFTKVKFEFTSQITPGFFM